MMPSNTAMNSPPISVFAANSSLILQTRPSAQSIDVDAALYSSASPQKGIRSSSSSSLPSLSQFDEPRKNERLPSLTEIKRVTRKSTIITSKTESTRLGLSSLHTEKRTQPQLTPSINETQSQHQSTKEMTIEQPAAAQTYSSVNSNSKGNASLLNSTPVRSMTELVTDWLVNSTNSLTYQEIMETAKKEQEKAVNIQETDLLLPNKSVIASTNSMTNGGIRSITNLRGNIDSSAAKKSRLDIAIGSSVSFASLKPSSKDMQSAIPAATTTTTSNTTNTVTQSAQQSESKQSSLNSSPIKSSMLRLSKYSNKTNLPLVDSTSVTTNDDSPSVLSQPTGGNQQASTGSISKWFPKSTPSSVAATAAISATNGQNNTASLTGSITLLFQQSSASPSKLKKAMASNTVIKALNPTGGITNGMFPSIYSNNAKEQSQDVSPTNNNLKKNIENQEIQFTPNVQNKVNSMAILGTNNQSINTSFIGTGESPLTYRSRIYKNKRTSSVIELESTVSQLGSGEGSNLARTNTASTNSSMVQEQQQQQPQSNHANPASQKARELRQYLGVNQGESFTSAAALAASQLIPMPLVSRLQTRKLSESKGQSSEVLLPNVYLNKQQQSQSILSNSSSQSPRRKYSDNSPQEQSQQILISTATATPATDSILIGGLNHQQQENTPTQSLNQSSSPTLLNKRKSIKMNSSNDIIIPTSSKLDSMIKLKSAWLLNEDKQIGIKSTHLVQGSYTMNQQQQQQQQQPISKGILKTSKRQSLDSSSFAEILANSVNKNLSEQGKSSMISSQQFSLAMRRHKKLNSCINYSNKLQEGDTPMLSGGEAMVSSALGQNGEENNEQNFNQSLSQVKKKSVNFRETLRVFNMHHGTESVERMKRNKFTKN